MGLPAHILYAKTLFIITEMKSTDDDSTIATLVITLLSASECMSKIKLLMYM